MKNEEIIKRIEPIADTLKDYYPDLLCDDNFIRLARAHSIELEIHVVGYFKEEPDYMIFELRPTKTAKEIGDHYVKRCLQYVIDLIFVHLDCCDDNVIIEDFDDDSYTYARVVAHGHYHS